MKTTGIILKIVLSILLFVCLLKMSYGYFQFVRVLSMIGFGILAFISYKEKKEIEMIVFIGLIVLFQPLIKIALGREIWDIVDVIVGVGLIVSIFFKGKSEQKWQG